METDRAMTLVVTFLAASALSQGWDNVNPDRTMPPPAQEVWRAPVEKGAAAFKVDWRDGAGGTFEVVGDAIRISKTNAVGRVVVTPCEPFVAATNRLLQGYAACRVEGHVDPTAANGYIRIWSGMENLRWERRHFGATASESPTFVQLVNTPPGQFTRKLCRTRVGRSGRVTAAIVVEGAPSVTVWSGWGVEDAHAADRRHQAENASLKPPDRSGTMVSEAEFDAALAADSDHSAKMVRTPAGGVLEVDGRPAPPILYKPIPFGMGVPFTGEGRMFEQAGVDLQVVNIRLGVGFGRIGFWSKDGFDCAGAVRRVKDFMRSAPHALFMVTIRCDAYPEYADEHPSEKWLRPDGTVVYGSCSQGQKKASPVPPPHTWPWVSNHSPVWRADVKRLMSQFVGELKRTGLAKRIVGVHLAGYHDGQFAVPVADFSRPAAEAFRRWQMREFGAVRWQEAPAFPEGRELLDPVEHAAQVAYQKFLKWGPMEMQEDFARHLKAEFGKPIVVGRWCMNPFGGSIMATLDFTPFVRSGALDFLVAQPAYHRRAPGLACGLRLPLASFRAHGKLFLNEFDLRTWHGRGGETEARSVYLSRAVDRPMWETVHRKLAGQMFANRMGWWYFDMADNWFDDAGVLADIASVRKTADRLGGRRTQWRPAAAVVLDEEGQFLRNRIGVALSMREVANTPEQLQTLAAASVPFDILLARDLVEGSVRGADYKALVMAGFYRIDSSRAEMIASLRSQGVKMLFLADAGACGGEDSLEGCERLAEPGGLTSARFSGFVRAAGGYVPTRPGLQVDMNGDFISVHCLETGRYDFALPFPADVENLKTGERRKGMKTLPLDLAGGETRWYLLHPAGGKGGSGLGRTRLRPWPDEAKATPADVEERREVLENSRAAFVFDGGRDFALSSIVDKSTGTRFDFDLSGGGSLWRMRRMEDGAPSAPVSAGRPANVVRLDGALRFFWPEAMLEVRLPDGSGIAEWRLEWRSKGRLPYSFTYPCVKPCPVGAIDRLYMPQRIGKVLDRPAGRDFDVAPACPNWWSAQYVLYCGDPSASRPVPPLVAAGKAIDGFVRGAAPHESTLYFSADDFAFWRKDLTLRGRKGCRSFDLGLTHFPPWPSSPADRGEERAFEWKAPYAVRFGVLPGGVQRGVAEYRRQAAGKLPCRRMSPLAAGSRAWRSVHCPPGELARIGHDMRETYRVPVTLHHYRYALGPFNWHFPELTSYRAGFREANEYLQSIDCVSMPYGNSMRYDRALASYDARGMERAAVVGMSGAVRATQLHGSVTSYMLPGAPEWIGWNRTFVADLFGKGGVCGFYLDEGAVSPAPLDYGPARHAPHGGTYWSDGMRALADALRREGEKFRADAFLSTEGFGEHLIGHVDDFLLYGLQSPAGLPSHARGFDHFPLMSLTYHDLAHAHSDRPDMSLGDDAFRLVMAQAWTWGMNIQVPATGTELAPGHAKKIAFCRDMVRCAWQIGDAYLSSGEMRYAALVPDAGQIGDAAIGVVSAPCRIEYRDRPWFGPSVLAGCFRDKATGDEAVALANVTDQEQKVRIAADRRRVAPGKRRLFRSWPLPVEELDVKGDVAIVLGASSVAFLEWRDDKPSPRALLPAPAPVPDALLRLDPNLPSPDSERTFHAFFAPGAILLPQAGDGGIARSTLTVRNFADRPLTVRLNGGMPYRLRAKSEAMLPVAVPCGASSDPQRVPVRIAADDGLPRAETLFFETAPEPPDGTIGHPFRPIRFSQPSGGPFRPMPFKVSAGARTFTMFCGWPGSGVGIVRTPDGRIAKQRHVGEDALLGMKCAVDVPEGADGREWTYSHAWGQAYLAFGGGVEPLRAEALSGFPEAHAKAGDAVGCVNRFGNLEVELPEAGPGRPVWTVAARIAYQGTAPCVVLHCDLGAERSGRICLPLEVWTDKGLRMTGYIQTFAQGTDGVRHVVAGDQAELRRPRGTQRLSLALDPPCGYSGFDVVLNFAVTPRHRLKVSNP